MKPFSLLLLLIVSGVLFETLFRPLGRLDALCQRLLSVPARFTDRRRHTLPATGLFGWFRRPLAGEVRHPVAHF